MAVNDKYRYHLLNRIRHQAADLAEKDTVEVELHEILTEMRMERKQLKKDLCLLEEELQKERRRNHNLARALTVARSQIRRLKKRFFSSSSL